MVSVLVTGGAGYVGSVLVPALLGNNFRVTVLDNFMYNNALSLAACCSHPFFEIINGDARNESTLAKALAVASPDFIIPLAAIVGAPACNKDIDSATTTNLEAIITLINMSVRIPIIYPNTNSGYGSSSDICYEDSPVNPLSLYAETKQAAEDYVIRHGGISLRLATVFGMSPRMRLDLLVNDFVYRAMNDGYITLYEPHFIRNFIHVRDVARAFVFMIENFRTYKGQAFNVGLDSANLSKLQLCEQIKKFFPYFTWSISESLRHDPDQRNYTVSNDKIAKTGWHPAYTLNRGIEEMSIGLRGVRSSIYGNV